eukprot:jgi/Ulvmu1/9502/UM052_0075.1
MDAPVGPLGPGEVLHLEPAEGKSDGREVKSALESILARHGVSVDEYQPDKLLLIPDQKVVELEAMHMGLRKRLAPQAQIEQGVEFDVYDANARDAFDNIDSHDFFTPAEVSMLTRRIISYIKIDEDFASKLRLQQITVHAGQPLLTALLRAHVLEDIMPVHDAAIHQKMMPKFWSPFPTTSAIRSYYGDSVALYFEWMQFMWTWLTVPGLMGLAIYITHHFTGETVEDSRFAPLYSVAMILWAVLFNKFWLRRQARLSVEWGTVWSSEAHDTRPEFTGTWRTSPVTGRQEIFFAPWRRWLRYGLSVLVTGTLLLFAFFIMICSLNLQGYIKEPGDELYIPALARYAEPGAVFDPARGTRPGLANTLLPLVPVLLRIAVIVTLNQVIYRRIAAALTTFENHRYAHEHRSSLIIKRFLFEAFDCYIALFYLAFWHLDILKVRTELQGMFMGDCARRLALEVLLPWLLQRASAARRHGQVEKLKAELGEDRPAALQAVADTEKEVYEDFDDYMEMAIQFGYVCLFAAAMPVAAAVAALYTAVEMRSDLVKLLHVCRRPAADRRLSIGAWQAVMQVQAWMAILTNCVVFTFSSDQVIEYFPSLFRTLRLPRGGVEKVVAEGSGRWLVTIWVVLEHSLALVALLLWLAIPSVPASVQEATERVQFRQQRDADEKRHEARRRIAADTRAARNFVY